MRRRLLIYLCCLSLAFIACQGDDDDSADDDDSVDDDDSADDDDSGDDTPPCGDGGWGEIGDPDNALHVRDDGSDDTGDGSMSAPFASLLAAIAASRESGASKLIAVGPGTFETNVQLWQDAGSGATDDGLVIEGCGADETVLDGGTAATATDPVIFVTDAQDVRLAGFATEGGHRALWIWNEADVTIELVDVRHSARLGIIIGGWDCFASLDHVTVSDTVVETDGGVEYGYGISVQDATVEMTDVAISGSTMVGLLVDVGIVTATRLAIDGTAATSDGYLGRGMQIQNDAFVDVRDSDIGVLAPNSDAGIFAQAPYALYVDNTDIDGTATGELFGESCAGTECPGEGIVVTQGDLGQDPSSFNAYLTNNTITNCTRAGVVIDSVAADLAGNTADDSNGYNDGTSSIYMQGNYVLTGLQDPPPIEEASPRPLYLELVSSDDLGL